MELVLKRIARKAKYTIGNLYVDGVRFCDTLEDTDRGLRHDMQLQYIRDKKIAGATAIPTGTYEIDMNVTSPKYQHRRQYDFCRGKLPRLVNVPGYSGILIHIGNYPQDTEGCILVGMNVVVGAVMESTETFRKLYDKMKFVADMGEKIIIRIE